MRTPQSLLKRHNCLLLQLPISPQHWPDPMTFATSPPPTGAAARLLREGAHD
jgi:hypothetical protein